MKLAERNVVAEVQQEESSDDGGNIVDACNRWFSTSCLIWTTPSNAHQPSTLLESMFDQRIPSKAIVRQPLARHTMQSPRTAFALPHVQDPGFPENRR